MLRVVRPSISVFDKEFNKEKTSKYILSIECSLNGFSFSVFDQEQNKFLGLEVYYFQNTKLVPQDKSKKNENDFHLLYENFDGIFDKSECLKQTFKSTNIVFRTQKSTLIPEKYFDENQKKTFLDFNDNICKNEDVFFDKLNKTQTYNVYALPKNVHEKLINTFPQANIFHNSSVLIESLIEHKKDKTVFVNVGDLFFDIIITENKNLIFQNSFSYKTKEDFIYYVLFVFQQLKINPETANFILLGEIEKDSSIYKILYKYIRNITFGERNKNFFYSDVFNEIPSHFYHNLLNVNFCEL